MQGSFDIGRRAAGVLVLLGGIALGAQAASAQINKVIYNCHDNTAVNATYDIGGDTLTLEIAGTVTIRLNQAVSGSGIRYVGGGGYEAYGKGNRLNVIRPGQPELRCTEIGRINPPAPQQQALPRPFQSQQQFTPPPAFTPQQGVRPGFSCSGRLNATEARICANPTLAGLDQKMVSTYNWLSGQVNGGERNRLKQDQRNWLARRNGCGANDNCIQGQISERIGYLNEWLTPGTPPPVQQQGGTGSFAAKSWGGIVRSGPGQQYAKIASLNEGELITVLQQTGQIFQDRPWYKISFRGRIGYHWGGIICPLGSPVPGTFQVCN